MRSNESARRAIARFIFSDSGGRCCNRERLTLGGKVEILEL